MCVHGCNFRRGMIDMRPGIVRDSFFKEVSFALERNHLHEIKWVGSVVVLLVAERYE
jgi:hypothetical protein